MLLSKCMLFGVEWGKPSCLPRRLERPGWLGGKHEGLPQRLERPGWLGANTKVCLGVSIFYLAALSRFTSMASKSKPDIQTENRPSQSP